ncbi:hypothetical protein [Hyphomonas pacifica]|uniref:Uncharacterized protein n=1 Tax=Hyphomonas pacifica TaxID=1280941 RepID=A0A062U4F0_9PROT|nr:hypothetical protein [Hyphomonas pacifica]KCZ52628.1 hypothetical protein HY2_07755 [Hyphomonas pacifica]RAN32831.1 hypothetical protein HY3_13945 [Hyphomonas pacifica]
MSQLSLISNAESIAIKFQLLIDEVLLFDRNADKYTELARLLRAAAAGADTDASHEGLLLDSLLRSVNGSSRTDLVDLAEALDESELSTGVRAALSDIAAQIGSERAALSSRLSPR